MFTDLSSRVKALTYAVIVMLSCTGLMIALRSAGEPAALCAMFTPAATVLIMMLVVTRDGRHSAGWAALGLRHAGFRYWPIALGLPVVLVGASETVVFLTGLSRPGSPTWAALPSFLLDRVVELAALCVFAFFEEIGWRGYLLPLVTGRRYGAAGVGLLNGLWHLPIVFIVTGAYLTEGNRWLTVPVFLGVLTAAGVIYGWMRERSGSVWPCVILHGSFNAAVGFVAGAMVTHDPGRVALVGRETGVATLGVLVLTGLWLTARPGLPRGEAGQGLVGVGHRPLRVGVRGTDGRVEVQVDEILGDAL